MNRRPSLFGNCQGVRSRRRQRAPVHRPFFEWLEDRTILDSRGLRPD
jgi:hypothetical protein